MSEQRVRYVTRTQPTPADGDDYTYTPRKQFATPALELRTNEDEYKRLEERVAELERTIAQWQGDG